MSVEYLHLQVSQPTQCLKLQDTHLLMTAVATQPVLQVRTRLTIASIVWEEIHSIIAI